MNELRYTFRKLHNLIEYLEKQKYVINQFGNDLKNII